MRLNKLLVPLACSMLFSSGVLAAKQTQPTQCYAIALKLFDLTYGQKIKLCSGTTDASMTLNCFVRAHSNPDDGEGGFGLTMGSSINLCKSNSEPF